MLLRSRSLFFGGTGEWLQHVILQEIEMHGCRQIQGPRANVASGWSQKRPSFVERLRHARQQPRATPDVSEVVA
jgi:hypothetical protein